MNPIPSFTFNITKPLHPSALVIFLIAIPVAKSRSMDITPFIKPESSDETMKTKSTMLSMISNASWQDSFLSENMK
jgi:hypothetical protein